MKKSVAIILAIALVAVLGVSAFAAGSVVAGPTTDYGTTTTALPTVTVVKATDDADDDDVLVSSQAQCPADYKEAMADAYASVADARPEGASVRYLFCVSSKDGNAPYSWTITFKMADAATKNVTAQQYVDGAWKNLTVVNHNDGTFDVSGDAFGPVAIFVK